MEQFSEKVMQALGEWKIEKFLGAGQYGKVYEIRREDFGTIYRAALKIITIPDSAEEVKEIKAAGMNDAEISNYFKGVVESFVQEFALMAKLKGHTNIVGYEDHQVIPADDGIGWTILIRMELLTSLINYVAENPMTRRDVIKLGIDLCKALELCQRVNVIHRDIKPANIFVSGMGEYKLGDFGVARIIENTMSGRTGTDTYMAPEVYYEEKYGPSADIYSLGIVMYRLLNGNRAPFFPPAPKPVTYRDKGEAFRRRINGEELPLPAQADGRLAEIVLKACAYRAADRYSSPVAMRKDLEAIQYEEREAEEIYPQGDGVSDREGLTTNGTVSLKHHRGKEELNRKVQILSEQKEEEEQAPSESEAEEAQDRLSEENDGAEKEPLPDSGSKSIGMDECEDKTRMLRKGNRNTHGSTEEAEEKEAPEPEEVQEKEILNPEKKEEIEIQEGGSEKKKKPLFLIPLAAVAVAGAAAVLFFRQPDTTAVIPDVCGITVTEAEDMLQEAGFTAEIAREYSDTVQMDFVINQDAAEGKELEKGSVVTLTVSAGEEPVVVPDVLSQKKKAATTELESLGFSVVIEEEYSSSKVNTVISQSIEGGTEAEKGQEITLVISKKRPDVAGLSLAGAVEQLKAEGFEVTAVKGESSSGAELHTVLGASYEIAETKTAVLSLNCIQVPDVAQMEKSAAIAALTAAGFSEENISSEEDYNSDVDAGLVYAYQVEETDWSELAGVPAGIDFVLNDGLAPLGAKISLAVSLGEKPQASTGSGSGSGASSYTAPAYTPSTQTQPAQTQPAPSTPKKDEGVVFSDGDGKVVN